VFAGGTSGVSAETNVQAAGDYCRFSAAVEGRSLKGELLHSPETSLVHARLKLAFPDSPTTGANRAFTDKVVYKSAWIERIHDFKTGDVTETVELRISHSLTEMPLVDACEYYVSNRKVGDDSDIFNVMRMKDDYMDAECSIEVSKFAGRFPARRFANDPVPVITVKLVRYEDDWLDWDEYEQEYVGQFDLSLDFSEELTSTLEASRAAMYQKFNDGQCRPLADAK
jgi:hypothetical protein